MIYAYFIGGSLDLSKRSLSGKHPPREYFSYKPVPFVIEHYSPEELAGTVVKCTREVYRLLGPCRHRNHETFIYEYDGDE